MSHRRVRAVIKSDGGRCNPLMGWPANSTKDLTIPIALRHELIQPIWTRAASDHAENIRLRPVVLVSLISEDLDAIRPALCGIAFMEKAIDCNASDLEV